MTDTFQVSFSTLSLSSNLEDPFLRPALLPDADLAQLGEDEDLEVLAAALHQARAVRVVGGAAGAGAGARHGQGRRQHHLGVEVAAQDLDLGGVVDPGR